MKKIEKQVNIKADKDYVKKKNKKNKRFTERLVEDLEDRLGKKVQKVEREGKQERLKLEQEQKEGEKKTLWKIRDCEELLKQRATEEYVEQKVKGMDGVIGRQVRKCLESEVGGLEGRVEHLEQRVEAMDTNWKDTIRTVDKTIQLQANHNRDTYL